MMRLFRIMLSIAVLGGAVRAQHSNGYVYFAPGGVSCCGHTAMTIQLGVGGEAILGKGIGVGAEIGAVGVRRDFGDSVVGIFSPNGYYHFAHGKGVKADPFVTGGYTLLFRTGHANLFNFGGGLNYWFRQRLGVRFEIRDQVLTDGAAVHYWGVRAGLVF